MREGRKKDASKVKQTNKAKQHGTPKAVNMYMCVWCEAGGKMGKTLVSADREGFQERAHTGWPLGRSIFSFSSPS